MPVELLLVPGWAGVASNPWVDPLKAARLGPTTGRVDAGAIAAPGAEETDSAGTDPGGSETTGRKKPFVGS